MSGLSYEWGTKCGNLVDHTLQNEELITVHQLFQPSNASCDLKLFGHQFSLQGKTYGNLIQNSLITKHRGFLEH